MRKSVFILCIALLLWQKGGAAGFSVSGTKLLDAKNNEFILRGINYAYAWYTGTINQSLPAIADAGANAVRIVLADGGQWTKVNSSTVKQLIDVCSKYKMVAVLEVHDATGDDGESSLLQAARYFADMASILKGTEDKVIINIANEWYGSWNTDPWAAGHKKAIKVVRDAGLTHTIMVDAAGWGQYPKAIHDAGKAVFDSDPLKNTMFSTHMYEYAGPDAGTIKKNIDGVINQNLCLCIGEFGFKHSDGDVDEQYILDYCQEKKVGWLAWSWHGNGGGVEYLDLARDASGSSLSDWGKTVVNGRNGLKETSNTCSVFTDDKPAISMEDATITILPVENNQGTYTIEVKGISEDATYSIQWLQSKNENDEPVSIVDAITDTFTVSEEHYQSYLRCEITGIGETQGASRSEPVLVDVSSAERRQRIVNITKNYRLEIPGIKCMTLTLPQGSEISLNEKTKVSIFALNGSLIYTENVSSVTDGIIQLNTSARNSMTANGTYFVCLQNKNGRNSSSIVSQRVTMYR